MNQSDIRAIALGLPEAEEHAHFDRPSFRVRGKIFATLPPVQDDRAHKVVLKLPVLVKESLQQTDASAIVSLGNWDKGGWTQLDIGRMDEAKMADLVRLAWKQVAPKTLLARGRRMTTIETQPSQGGRRAAFGFIFALSVINSISFGIMIPILPNLIKQFTGGDTATASEWNVVFAVTWGVMQFFIGPILGMVSDRYGRRPVLLLSLLGLAVDFLFMALAPTLGWLLVGRILNGLTAASFSTANAYVADVTPPDQRAKVFGWMGSAFSFGFLIGPVVGGYLGTISLTMAPVVVAGLTIDMALRLPFFVAAGLTLINFLYGLFVLPESLAPEKRATAFAWKKANPVGSLKLLQSHPDLLGLATVLFLFQLAHTVLPSIFVLYTGYRYGWSPAFMGMTMGLTGILGICVSIFLVGPVVKRIGERGALLVGAFFGALGFAIYAFAPTTGWYLVGTPVFALMGFLMPGLMGLMSRRVPPQEQGQLQGANQSVQGISSILGPLMFGLIFAWSVHNDRTLHLPGLAICVAAGLNLLAFLLGLTVTKAPKSAEPPAA